jgi:hypothetical protein
VPPLQRRERTYEFQPSGDPIQSKTAVNTSEVDITPREDIGFADNFTFANFRTPIEKGRPRGRPVPCVQTVA